MDSNYVVIPQMPNSHFLVNTQNPTHQSKEQKFKIKGKEPQAKKIQQNYVKA